MTTPRQPIHLLLVEDETMHALVVRKLLSSLSSMSRFRVTHVERLQEALACLAEGDVDAILLDLALPDCAGVETARRVLKAAPDVPIVALSATEDEELALEVVEAGAQDFVVKHSVDAHILTRAISYALVRHRQRQAERAEPAEQLSGAAGLERFVAGSSDAMVLCDDGGVIRQVNALAEQILGGAGGELIGKPFPHAVEDGAVASFGEAAGKHELRVLTARQAGAPLSVVSLKPLGDAAERERSGAMVALEVQALRRAIPALFLKVDGGGRIVEVARGAGCDVRFPGAEWVGKRLSDLLPEEAAGMLGAAMDRVLSTGEVQTVEYQSEDGQEHAQYHEVRIAPFHDGELFLLVCNKTDHQVFARKLEAQAESYRSLFDAAPEGIAIHDGGKILDANRAFCQLFDIERQSVGGRSILDLVSREFRELVRQQLATGFEQPFEANALRTGGETFVAEFYGRPHVHMHRRVYMAYVRDITARKLAQEALRRSEAQLRGAQRMEAVGRLAGGIAHDFNNLLTAITGFGGFVKSALPEGSPERDDMDEVLSASRKAAGLTKQLLAFSRRQIIEPRIVNLNTIISNMEKMLRRLVREDIHFTTAYENRLWHVRIDPGQFEQVLVNLVVNAVDALPDPGAIRVETANMVLDEAYTSEYRYVVPGEYVMLAVTDTGIGMEEETMAHVFEPFFSTKEATKGTGLGLATCYGIIKQHDGYIQVYSTPGEGSTFQIFIPRVDGVAQGLPEATKSASSIDGAERILVVEDEDIVRSVATRALRRHGYEVLAAADGKEALQICQDPTLELDLMLTDVVMPGLSGAKLADKVVEMRPELKILFMSGYTDDAIADEGVLNEATAFIPKPFTAEEIVQRVREVLDDE